MQCKRLFAFIVILVTAHGSRIQSNLVAQVQSLEAEEVKRSEEHNDKNGISSSLGIGSLAEIHDTAWTPEEGDFIPCPPGDTTVAGCLSMCKHLGLTSDATPNGECPDFLTMLEEKGYGPKAFWKILRSDSALDPVLELLSTNAYSHQVAFHISYLRTLLKAVSEEERQTYADSLRQVGEKIAAYLANASRQHHQTDYTVSPEQENDGGTRPLPTCFGKVQPGDFLTFEVGGPDFEIVTGFLTDTAANAEALQIQKHFWYGKHFEYGKHFDWDNNPYDHAKDDGFLADAAKSTANFFARAGKISADVVINIGKGIGDATINVGKGLGDIGYNGLKQIARGFMFTGAGITALYASVRQTTSHTGKTKWTHSEIAVGENKATSARGAWDMCSGDQFTPGQTKVIVSRFVGNRSLITGGVVTDYKLLAARRALMWEPYLGTYAATIGQWHKVILGKCLNVRPFNAGESDYFEAVTKDKVEEMWNYDPGPSENEQSFFAGVMKWTQDSFRTHDEHGRVKPKAMFCSKFSSAVWSSVIGNPTDVPTATVRQDDINKMFPFNPGACSPWTIVQWMLGNQGRKYWTSCIMDPASQPASNPCKS